MAQRFFVGTRKGLFTYDKTPAGWTAGPPAFLAEPVTAVLDDPRDDALYTALNLGHFGRKLHRSEDKGKTWTEISAPAFPETDAEDGPSVDMIWALAAGGAGAPGELWAGTIPGALFHSTDKGESWALVSSLWDREERGEWFGGGFDAPGIHSILVHPRDPNKLTLGISCGGVWKSADRGQSWRLCGQGLRSDYTPPEMEQNPNLQDPHLLACSKTDPDTIWCQHHNGVFVSRDGGENFVELFPKPSVFGFAVAAHPKRPDTAWLVPGVKDETRVPVDAKLIVNRTTDGGETFTALSGGLPEEPSYDLVYRHALAVDETGENLVMGSTTGNLWASGDGGENWTLLSSFLPPIAVVSFATG